MCIEFYIKFETFVLQIGFRPFVEFHILLKISLAFFCFMIFLENKVFKCFKK